MSDLIPIGIDLGSLHARLAIGTLTENSSGGGNDLTDTVTLPSIISNAQGSRFTLALVGDDGDGNEGASRYIFGDAARRALLREKKPTIYKEPTNLVRELVKSNSSLEGRDEEKSKRSSAFFSHLADLACDASSAHHSKLRSVVGVPVGSTAEQKNELVSSVNLGIREALSRRDSETGNKTKKGDVEFSVLAALLEPAAVCIAHGLTEKKLPSIDLASQTESSSPCWKNVLVIDFGASGLTCTHLTRPSDTSTLLQVVNTKSDATCSGNEIISTLTKHCASMFERKTKVSGVLDSSKARHKLEMACEAAVRTLSRAPTTTVSIDGLYEGMDMNVPLSQPRFQMLLSGILRKAEALLQSFMAENEVEFDVVLTSGNVSDMPSARNLIRTKLFPNAYAGRNDVPSDEAVAIGCARHAAAILSCDTHKKDSLVNKEGCPCPSSWTAKACPITIGVCRLEKGKENSPEVDEFLSESTIPFISAGEPLPALNTRKITYQNGDDTWLSNSVLAIVQQKNGTCKMVGKIDDIPASSKDIEITLGLSAAGKLSVAVDGGDCVTL